MTRKFRISRKDKKAIEEAVARAEKRTSGEIVPMIVRQSHNYWWVHWYWAGMFVALISASLWWATSEEPWALYLHEWLRTKTDYTFWNIRVHDALLVQLCAALFGFGLGFLEPVKRMVLPKRWTDKQVHHAALANFMACGLTETRDRTGVLIFISHLEHRVEILADKGINEKVPAGFWQEQADVIVKGIHTKRASQAIIHAINAIGEMLAQNYPPHADDTNELPNTLQMDGYSQSMEETETDPDDFVEENLEKPESSIWEEQEAPKTTETWQTEESSAALPQESEIPPSSGEAPSTPLDFPAPPEEDSNDVALASEDELTNTNAEPISDKEPSDSPLGELNLEEEDTHTNFNIGELPSIHLEDTSPFGRKNKKDED
ncbi:MAG: hypothetical protein KDD39_12335 [Bdellovibrionales bacterium]|nr:hypothetical protein [Bdellovibrionales bacterium]